MKIISHRGNLNGRQVEKENSPQYITQALNAGFDVEIDVWVIDGCVFLGHDLPQYKVEVDFLKTELLWCHAKNIDALELLLKNNTQCFWHNTDTFTLTSKNIVWCYSDVQYEKGVMVCLEKPKPHLKPNYAVCTDFPILWKEWRNDT